MNGTFRGHPKGSEASPASGRSAGGFTLLEAVVALAIFSAGAMALYGLFNTNLISLSRAHDTMDQAPYVDYAIDYLSAVNPRLRPEGQVDLGGFDVTWTATLVEPVRQSQNGNGFMGNFEIGLYEVAFEVRVLDLGDGGLAARATSLGVYRMRLVGFEKVRGLGGDFAAGGGAKAGHPGAAAAS